MELAKKKECKDIAHLEQFFQDVIDKGGEGVILRDPLAPLQPGRSPGYLKHKVRTSTYYCFLFLLLKFFSEIQGCRGTSSR